MEEILIKNGRVWDGERFFYADVLTKHDVVVGLESNITADAAVTFDAAGKIVSAGLVDAHTHLRGISTNKFGTQGEISCIPFGVTAAADASGEQGDKNLLDSFLLKTVVFAKARIRDNLADFTTTEERLRLFGERAVGIKVYFDTSMTEVNDTRPLRQVCDFAHERGLRVMVHCTNAPVSMAELLATLGAGDILTHSFHGGVNTVAEDGFASMREAQERGVIIDVGFAGHVHTDFAILKRAFDCGIIPDVISTDVTRLSSYTRGGRYGMTLCMSIARHLGLSEEALFRAVTSAPARALGKQYEWGGLCVGKRADLAVFDYTNEGFDLTDKAGNRVTSATGYRCVLTLSNGQVVYRN